MKTLVEVDYRCTKCGNTQTISFFPSDPMLSVTNCMKCGAGREMTVQEQLHQHAGMFPVGKPKVLQGENYEEKISSLADSSDGSPAVERVGL